MAFLFGWPSKLSVCSLRPASLLAACCPLTMKTILVTGGCGFIGSSFVKLLSAQRSYRVVNLDKLTYAGNLENTADLAGENNRFVQGDICDRARVERILKDEKPWAIVNFAAESHVDRSILDAAPFLRTNIGGVQTLLEAIRSYPVERFLHISTDEVYGDKDRTRVIERRIATVAEQSLCRYESCGRSTLLFLSTYLRFADNRDAELEQLRPLSVPGKTNSAANPKRAQ